MTSMCLAIRIVLICYCLSNFMVDCKKRGLEVEEGVVKTIQTEDGVYNCVDFYKQPSLNHPSLKNHSFHPQMRPSSRPNFQTSNNFSNDDIFMMDIKLKGETCPEGTVPIRRSNNDHKQSQNNLRRESYAQLGEQHSNAWSQSNTYFAIGQSKSDIQRVYNGIASSISVFNPAVKRWQYSSGEIIIKGGKDAIITGWTVNPMVYPDTQTRFFIYTVSGDSHCMNSECGFIQVRSDIPLDFPIKPISTVEGTKYNFPVIVYQDPKNGNWWLEMGPKNIILGFWPQKFFHGLYESGTYVACGGEVYGPPILGDPKMGSGYKPKSNEPEWSYCHNVEIVDEAQNIVVVTDLESFSNNEDHYSVNVYNNGRTHYVFYGGPSLY